jgi:1-acyl-sn-glycerol-3-phosphate acyltransferase
MERLVSVVAPLARVSQPRVWGAERLPDRGALFVGNHTIFGFLDLPFMMSELWTRRGIAVRGLGDHGHYAIPVWRDLLERATRCSRRSRCEAKTDNPSVRAGSTRGSSSTATRSSGSGSSATPRRTDAQAVQARAQAVPRA